jgi:hypothetical protein
VPPDVQRKQGRQASETATILVLATLLLSGSEQKGRRFVEEAEG